MKGKSSKKRATLYSIWIQIKQLISITEKKFKEIEKRFDKLDKNLLAMNKHLTDLNNDITWL